MQQLQEDRDTPYLDLPRIWSNRLERKTQRILKTKQTKHSCSFFFSFFLFLCVARTTEKGRADFQHSCFCPCKKQTVRAQEQWKQEVKTKSKKRKEKNLAVTRISCRQ